MQLPIKCSVWLESPNIEIEGKKILPQLLDIEPIMGTHRKIIEIHNPAILTAAKRSRMRLDQYLSTLFNLAYAKEFAYRDLCCYHYEGTPEVEIPGIGRLDVLTATSIIEVKHYNRWKHALGQILAYSDYFPNHKPVIALTPAKKTQYRIEDIKRICDKYNVDVIEL